MCSGTSSPGSRFRVDMAPDAVGPGSPILSNHVGGGYKSPSMVASPTPILMAQSPPPLDTVPEMNGHENSVGGGSTASPEQSPRPAIHSIPSIELPDGE